MRKSDLVEAVMDIADMSARDAEHAVDGLVEHITNALARGESVNLVGFGAFHPKERAARTGINPQTGESLEIGKSCRVAFKPGKHFKELVNGG
ncbi:MAG: DNA-binding protein HU [Alteromonadaceae bacterium]|nr:MAG: DNA-binding protein HU [Alteromonadaceae bacterium]